MNGETSVCLLAYASDRAVENKTRSEENQERRKPGENKTTVLPYTYAYTENTSTHICMYRKHKYICAYKENTSTYHGPTRQLDLPDGVVGRCPQPLS